MVKRKISFIVHTLLVMVFSASSPALTVGQKRIRDLLQRGIID